MNLGDRMKRYEEVYKGIIMPRVPTIIRLDGKAFRTWTSTLKKPFDENLVSWMAQTTQYLVDNIQNAVFGYSHSDEISIFLRDYSNIESQQWYGGVQQKLVSVSSSMATAQFNYIVSESGDEYNDMPLALFDSRVFTLPKEEVTNYFIWRQRDCIRNSIQALGQHLLGHRECNGIKTDDLIEKMIREKDVNWNELAYHFRHGIMYTKGSTQIDVRIPKFSELREIIDVHIN